MKIHFIAIGGSAMHNLAIALKLKGYTISGSDDEIFDPAKSRLAKYGILPSCIGWQPELITKELDAVILGMHAREDNPELKKAKELGVKIYSYPEYLYEQTKKKTRVVVGGSHGKTTITAMIIHVLQQCGVNCDYMVGAQLDGFEVMVKISDSSEMAVIEGDEYLTSPIDKRPKFHLYQPNIGVISGIAWDHINVFPTFDVYKEQFQIFAEMIPADGHFIYYNEDPVLKNIADTITIPHKVPYSVHPHRIDKENTILLTEAREYPILIFGQHNLANLNAARLACNALGIENEDFYKAITSFKGAFKRMELLAKNDFSLVYKDFAHSPSKLKATIEAVKKQYPEKRLVACMELHTFSSLTKEFLSEYKNSMDQADIPIVFFSMEALQHKRLPLLSKKDIYEYFDNHTIQIFNNSDELISQILSLGNSPTVYLFMSSGNFNGINLNELANKIVPLQSL